MDPALRAVPPQIQPFPFAVASAGIFVAIAGEWLGLAVLVAFLWGLQVWHETRQERARRNDQDLGIALEESVEAFRAEDYPRAVALCESIVEQPTTPRLRARALAIAAWSYLAMDDLDTAAKRISQLPAGREPPPLFQGILLVKANRPEAAIPFLERALRGEDPDLAAGYLGRAYADSGRPGEAVKLLLGDPFGRNFDDRAFAQVEVALLVAGHTTEAAKVAEAGFSRFGVATHAFHAACAHARAGRAEQGLRWLTRAVEAGFTDAERVDTDGDLAPVRALPEYPRVRARLT